MKTYLIIVLLVWIVFGQDVYPYFSDMAKQLEFERKRIIIEEGEEKQQIISGGGSEFNFLSLLIDSEPTYKTASIETKYKYYSFFNIKRDSKNISEIQLLRIVGLDTEADKITTKYKNELDRYKIEKLEYKNSLIEYNEYMEDYYNAITYNIIGACAVAIGVMNSHDIVAGLGVVVFVYAQFILTSFEGKSRVTKPKKPNSLPTFRQQLNNTQIKSIVEAYNRKLYSEIGKK